MTVLVAKLLGLVVAIGLLGIILLATGVGAGRPIPDPLTIITTSALSGLLGLLARPALDAAPKRRRRRPPATDGAPPAV